MVDPLLALAVGLAIVAGFAFFFWPNNGLRERWQKSRKTGMKVQMEDALKHMYNCEYRGITCTQESITGSLEIPADRTTEVLRRLEAMNLVQVSGDGLVLTEEGRSYALRVIRVHRLWERYLADETGLDEISWHAEAEKQEHVLSAEEADSLAEQMGNPRYDPHGDPIPTGTGDLPERTGSPLPALKVGAMVRIVHIEDEPETTYAQLVANGLHPGMLIHLMSVTAERIMFETEGREIVLAPVIAANITGLPIKIGRIEEPVSDTLASLQPGERGRVVALSQACRGLQRRRLMDLGVIPGTIIKAEMRSAGGDPMAYAIRGTMIALREKQARQIHLARMENE